MGADEFIEAGQSIFPKIIASCLYCKAIYSIILFKLYICVLSCQLILPSHIVEVKSVRVFQLLLCYVQFKTLYCFSSFLSPLNVLQNRLQTYCLFNQPWYIFEWLAASNFIVFLSSKKQKCLLLELVYLMWQLGPELEWKKYM